MVSIRDIPSMATIIALEQQLQLGGSASLIAAAAPHVEIEEKCGHLFARYVERREHKKLVEYSLCAASVVCPEELQEWSACFRSANGDARALDRCRRLKREIERCGRRYTAELLEAR